MLRGRKTEKPRDGITSIPGFSDLFGSHAVGVRESEAVLLLGHLIGSAFRAGAFLGGGAAAAHLDRGQGTDALGAVVVGAAGDGAFDAVVGVHVIHGITLLFEV